jgi:trehalose synthase
MARKIDVRHKMSLEDYSTLANLSSAVRDLTEEARVLSPRLRDRTIWMISSTAQGGGVAEMLPPQISILRELGISVEWLVIEPTVPDFFPLTKRIHNLLHGSGDPELGSAERELYDAVSRECADDIEPLIGRDDVLIVHDPQPLGAGALLKERLGVAAIWRCHIGLDEHTPETGAAWSFLRPYAEAYDHSVFSVPEYIPPFLAGHATIIHPAIDPLSHKNRDLSIHKLIGILCDSDLMRPHGPLMKPLFEEPARRLQPDGSWKPATAPADIGLVYRPIVTQVSRWDRLKGFAPLLQGFRQLKEELPRRRGLADLHHRTVASARLVLAGPDPAAVADDPEATAVLDELAGLYLDLPPDLEEAVVLLALPMTSIKQNALMVNSLQRCSTLVVQNSLREGFGLTATEAMWKQVAVLTSGAAGLRQQVRDEIDGRIVWDASDPAAIATVLDEMLADEKKRERWGRTAQRRVYDNFLIFPQIRSWLETIIFVLNGRYASRAPSS